MNDINSTFKLAETVKYLMADPPGEPRFLRREPPEISADKFYVRKEKFLSSAEDTPTVEEEGVSSQDESQPRDSRLADKSLRVSVVKEKPIAGYEQ